MRKGISLLLASVGLLSFLACANGESKSDAQFNALQNQFSQEPTDVRAFRARGMMNHYYALKRKSSSETEPYLLLIMRLFPEFEQAKVEYVLLLEQNNKMEEAYQFLLSHQTLNSPVLKAEEKRLSSIFNAKPKSIETPVKLAPKPKPIIKTEPAKIIAVIKTYDDLMNHYYLLQREKKAACDYLRKKSERFLKYNSKIKDSNKTSILLELGYCTLANNELRVALDYFLRAQQLDPTNYFLANQIGFIENKLDENKKAYAQFKLASQSKDEKISSVAKTAMINLSDYKFNIFPPPWFFELYTEPYYYSRFNDTIYPLESRFGVELGKNKQYRLYLSYRRTTDTQSQSSGEAPQIYNDNVEVFAVGARYFPIVRQPLFLYFEYGLAHNLIYQAAYPDTEQDYRGGVVYSNYWGSARDYHQHFFVSKKPWADFYGNVSYYSRYQNMIGQLTGRAGISLFSWRYSTLSPYVKAQTFFDSQRLFYNNIVEYGPGVIFQPYRLINLAFSFEHLFGTYLPVPNSTNPYGAHYQTNIVRLQFYIKL